MKPLALAFVLLFVQSVSAQQIYKSVDKQGNVSYSSEPAKGAVKVETVAPPPAPSRQDVEQAQERYRELEARDAEREASRREQEKEYQRQQQIRADLDLKRQIADQNKRRSPSVIVINRNPWYWGRPYPPLWRDHHRPGSHSMPQNPPVPGRSGPVTAPMGHR